MVPETKSITQTHLQRLLLLGLCLSAMLLLSALFVAWRAVHQINRNTQTFADRQSHVSRIGREQAPDGDVFVFHSFNDRHDRFFTIEHDEVGL